MRSDNQPARSIAPTDLTDSLVWGFVCQAIWGCLAVFFRFNQPRLIERPAIARNTCAATLYSVRSVLDPDHEASIRFGGKAPRRRAHSPEGIEARFLFGSPPPRIIDGQSGKPTGR